MVGWTHEDVRRHPRAPHPRRRRFAGDAGAGARFIDASEDLDLFALRALANQPMRVLGDVGLRVSPISA